MNDKPRYTEGSVRNKMVNLMHISSVITPRSYKLLNEPQSSIANTMCKMKKEGAVEKGNNVEMSVLDKICVELKCQLSDIAEITFDD